METIRMKAIRIGFIILVVSILSACGGAEERTLKHLQKAKAFYANSNLEKARVEVKNALQISPANVESRYLFGQIQEQRKDYRSAIANYKSVVNINPTHRGAKLRLSYYFLRSSKKTYRDKGEKYIEEILELDPKNTQAIAFKGLVRYNEKDYEGALKYANQSIKINSTGYIPYLVMYKVFKAQNQLGLAIDTLSVAIKKNPANEKLINLLLKLHYENKNFEQVALQAKALIKLNPDETRYDRILVSAYTLMGEKTKALRALEKTINRHPKVHKYKLELANFIDRQFGHEKALLVVDKYIKLYPNVPELLLAKAGYLSKNKKNSEAELLYKKLIDANLNTPSGIAARIQYAEYLLSSERLTDASKQIAVVLRKNSRDTEALMLQGRIAYKNNNAQKAIISFQSVLSYKHNSIPAMKNLALAYEINQDFSLAKSTLNRIEKQAKQDLQAAIILARLHRDSKDYKKARALLNRVITARPDDERAIAELFDLQIQTKELKGLEAKIKEAIEKKPESKILKRVLVKFYMVTKQYDTAIGVFSDADKDPVSGNISDLLLLADVHIKSEKLSNAIKVYDRLLKLYPDNRTVQNNLALLLVANKEDNNNIKRARKLVSSFKTSDNALMIDTWGWVSYRSGHYDEALASLKRAAEKSPGLAEIQYHLGMVYYKKKKYAQAKVHLQRAVDSEQAFTGIKEAKNTLKSIVK